MNFELSVYQHQRRKVVAKIFVHVVAAAMVGIAGYFVKSKIDSFAVDIGLLFAGILGMYSLSVLPHFFTEFKRISSLIKSAKRSWVVKDEHGQTVSSYHSFEELKDQNQVQFAPNNAIYKYTILNTITGETKGTLTQTVTSHWEPFQPNES